MIIGDMNRAVGCDNLGIKGSNSRVSPGGQLIRELLQQEAQEKQEYFLLNASDMAEGGPWTWVSRADSSVRSCIDLCIVSANLMPYVT